MTSQPSSIASSFAWPSVKRLLRSIDRTHFMRIGMVVLLVVSIVQVLWWYLDQKFLIERYTDQVEYIYTQDIKIAETLFEHGTPTDEVINLLPHLDFMDGEFSVHAGVLENLGEERASRIFRYQTESGFFILVLFAGISVLWKAISDERKIRANQDGFLMMVSHEFKTPIASLQLAAESMLRRMPSAEDLERKVKRMLSDLGRMENMVSKILDSARLQQGHVHLTHEPVNLSAAVAKALSTFELDPLRENLTYSIDVPVDIQVDADPLALDTVLLNILENAHEAMRPQGGGELTIETLSFHDHVSLIVKDTGIGFSPEKGRNLFDKFYRTDDAYCGDKSGTGLGLFIVSRLMRLQHGSVYATSDGEGMGATFTMRWRRATN